MNCPHCHKESLTVTRTPIRNFKELKGVQLIRKIMPDVSVPRARMLLNQLEEYSNFKIMRVQAVCENCQTRLISTEIWEQAE